MCEKCEAVRTRNTVIKRSATDALFAEPVVGSLGERALADVPGYSAFLEIGRRLESLSRLAAEDARSASEKQEAMALITSMTAEGRTDAIRVTRYIAEMCEGIHKNLVVAKLSLNDADGVHVAVAREGDALVIRVNGQEVERIEMRGRTEDDAIDEAERAMQAHRTQYHGDE